MRVFMLMFVHVFVRMGHIAMCMFTLMFISMFMQMKMLMFMISFYGILLSIS